MPPKNHRPALIAELVPPGSRVLDLGCGNGELLAPAARIAAAAATASRSTTTTCWPARSARRQRHPAQPGRRPGPLRGPSFDVVLQLETLQHLRNTEAMLRETARVGRIGIVSFPNFCALAEPPSRGHRPHAGDQTAAVRVVRHAQHPRRHLCADFEVLARKDGCASSIPSASRTAEAVRRWPNLLASVAVFKFERG